MRPDEEWDLAFVLGAMAGVWVGDWRSVAMFAAGLLLRALWRRRDA